MAIDTASRRASAMNFSRGHTVAMPVPDGTVSQEDRQHLAYMYAGIQAGAAVFAPSDTGQFRHGIGRIRIEHQPLLRGVM
jgi:hypothetical protein